MATCCRSAAFVQHLAKLLLPAGLLAATARGSNICRWVHCACTDCCACSVWPAQLFAHAAVAEVRALAAAAGHSYSHARFPDASCAPRQGMHQARHVLSNPVLILLLHLSSSCTRRSGVEALSPASSSWLKPSPQLQAHGGLPGTSCSGEASCPCPALLSSMRQRCLIKHTQTLSPRLKPPRDV